MSAGTSPDCNANGTPDECDIAAGTSSDCNANGVPDECDVLLLDCNGNGIPDDCEADCNANGTPDDCDVTAGTSPDCNANGTPDECDLSAGTSLDCNANGVPDECDALVADCNANGIPDDCEPDCNANGVADPCDITAGTSLDCNSNGMPDECEADCDSNGVPDDCDVAGGGVDCNGNGLPDACDIAAGTSLDADANGVPDECEIAFVAYWDFEDGSGATATDISGNGIDGSLIGPQWVTETNDGSDSALRFDGVDDLIALPTIDVAGSELTIAAWVKADDFGIFDARIVSKSSGVSEGDHYWMLSTIRVGPDYRPRFPPQDERYDRDPDSVGRNAADEHVDPPRSDLRRHDDAAVRGRPRGRFHVQGRGHRCGSGCSGGDRKPAGRRGAEVLRRSDRRRSHLRGGARCDVGHRPCDRQLRPASAR